MAEKQTAGRDRLGDLAPKFAELNDDVLFGEVWSREEQLSPRDRSMITIAALFSAGLYPQLKSHLEIGKTRTGCPVSPWGRKITPSHSILSGRAILRRCLPSRYRCST